MPKKIDLVIPFDVDIAAELCKQEQGFKDFRILSKSLDARNASRGRVPRMHYQIELIYGEEEFSNFYETREELTAEQKTECRPVIVGLGPAGLFTALRFLDYGIPSVILERGSAINERMRDIAKFWRYGELNEENNVCFGAGGAGLFSDGKLVTRIKSPFIAYVMKRLVDFGAPEYIAYEANPHLGSNKMRRIIGRLISYLQEQGCSILYNTALTDFTLRQQQVVRVSTADQQNFDTNCLILATGHSAKDIYYLLERRGIALQAKDFAVGVRVEHPRSMIDTLQYGEFAAQLGAARYRLSHHDKSCNRGCFSFCMCPGGYVLSSGTEQDGIVTNGMSNFHHNSPWSNAAFIVSVKQGIDFAQDKQFSVKSALAWQHSIEQRAYALSRSRASGREIPALRLQDFLDGKVSHKLPPSSTPSGTVVGKMEDILPAFILDQLRISLSVFDKKIKGFITNQAVVLAPETRTSSCVTMVRDRELLHSVSCHNLYPCGEGAGYAGGITSSAVDGVKVVEAIIKKIKEFK